MDLVLYQSKPAISGVNFVFSIIRRR